MKDRIPSDRATARTEPASVFGVPPPSGLWRHSDHGTAEQQANIYSIMQADVEASTHLDGPGLERTRDDLFNLVGRIAHAGGVGPEFIRHNDTGDGLRLFLAPDVLAPPRVIDVFVDGLGTGLRRLRRMASDAARIRLRVAFHFGLVKRHLDNWTGPSLAVTERLVNAGQVRSVLRADKDVDLAAVVSNEMYQVVVRDGFGQIPVERYRKIRVSVKEYKRVAWLLLPDQHKLGRSAPE
jgi:hypothetical protein